ncbi:MAG: type I secretion system permease/ATPase [Thalassobaculales bacterium]
MILGKKQQRLVRQQHTASNEIMRQVFSACRSAFFAAGVFSFAVNMLILTVPFYMFSMFDRVISSQNLVTLLMLFIIANVSLLVQAAIDICRSYVFIHVSAFIDRRLAGQLLSLSITNALTRGNARSGEALSKLNSLRSFLAGQSIYNLMDTPWIPIFIGVLFILNFWIGVVAVVGAALLATLAVLNKVVSRKAMALANQSGTQAMKTVNAAVRNAEVVEAMGMGPAVVRRWHELNEQTIARQSVASVRAAYLAAFSKYARMLVQMSIMTVSALEILAPGSTMTGGAMMAAVILAGRALAPLESVISNWQQLQGAKQNYDDIAQMLNQHAEKPRSSVVPPQPKGLLSVEGVSYQPRGAERPILNRIHFQLEPGESLGIIGASASGKTTLASLIVGLHRPTHGTVRLDGADVYFWPSEDLGRHIGYLPQEVALFQGSVRDNIARLDPDAEPEDIIAAAELAGLHEMIQHLPKGYDTEVGDQGTLLSGGQRQRVGLARALYGNPTLVVLDEPNSSLDSAGEDALTAALDKLKARGATVIVIAHRPHILRSVDKILVLQNGSMQRFAARDEVLPLITGGRRPAVQAAPNVQAVPRQVSG